MSLPPDKGDIETLDQLASLLDERFRIPGTRIRFGWDGVIGLLPGVGDAVGAAMSGYVILRARRLGVPRRLLIQMLWNMGIDTAVGVVPLVGDAFDVGFKANRRNVELLRKHLAKQR